MPSKKQTADEQQPASRLPEWARVLKMHWPRTEWINDGDFQLAVRQLNRAIDRNPPSEDELLQVVGWMAGPDSQQKYAPSLRELIINVFVFRKQRDGGGDVTYAGNSGFVDHVQRAMTQAQGWRERWNIMCQPSLYAGLNRDPDYDETLKLDSWAETKWKEWRERTHEIKASMGEGIRMARLAMFGGIRNESKPVSAELRYIEIKPDMEPCPF
jgi:hypothetical protein